MIGVVVPACCPGVGCLPWCRLPQLGYLLRPLFTRVKQPKLSLAFHLKFSIWFICFFTHYFYGPQSFWIILDQPHYPRVP